MTNTLHVLGIPHTVANQDHLICAFTAKVLLFPQVIRPFGWYVIEYSNEGSESWAHEHAIILTTERLTRLSNRKSRRDAHEADLDNKQLGAEFQERLLRELKARVRPGDIVCHVWGPNIDAYDATRECHHIELSVGYESYPGLPFRIFESSAWMHYHYAKAGESDGNHYRWVVPSAFDEEKWTLCDSPGDYAVFLGRVTPRKGINILVEIARRMPELPVHVYGPGDTSPWMAEKPDNLIFQGALFGDERVEVVRRARCMLMPTSYIEPFGFSGIEGQLCGVPLLGTSFGAFQETIIDGVTGYRCHTLADWIEAIRWSAKLDRATTARSARDRYSKRAVGQQYDWVLRQLGDLSGPGWYSPRSRKFESLERAREAPLPQAKIWLYIPYFGSLPNYFSLFLSGLGRNGDILRVVFITDIDLTDYDLPENFLPVPMTLPALRQRIARLLMSDFNQSISSEKLAPYPYKLVDFKPLYPELFASLGDQHGATERDFVGWGDVDLLYGRVADFLRFDEGYDVIGGFHGHLTAVRNRPEFRTIYKQVPELLKLLQSPEQHAVDEIAFRQPLLDFLQERGARMFYTNRYFCDVVPTCFVDRFRPGAVDPELCFFDAYHPNQDIHEIRIEEDGRIVVIDAERHEREAIYCHLQKRPMALEVNGSERPIFIRRTGFYAHPLRAETVQAATEDQLLSLDTILPRSEPPNFQAPP